MITLFSRSPCFIIVAASRKMFFRRKMFMWNLQVTLKVPLKIVLTAPKGKATIRCFRNKISNFENFVEKHKYILIPRLGT